ncbi:MAG: hypothetical protein ACK56F_24250, partial [bacterium]
MTGYSPYYLVFGQNLSLAETVLLDATQEPIAKSVWEDNLRIAATRLRRAYQKEAEKWNSHIKWSERVFQVDDVVLVFKQPPKTDLNKGVHRKLISGWEGPYRVISKMEGRDVYRVKLVGEDGVNDEVVNVKRMKKFVRAPEWLNSVRDMEVLTGKVMKVGMWNDVIAVDE